MNKNIIIGIVLGICIAVTAFHVWYLYRVNKLLSAHESALIQQGQALSSVIKFLEDGNTK